MTTTDLTSFGSGNGLKIWSLDDIICNLSPAILDKLIDRSHSFLNIYGPYDESKSNFLVLMTDVVYYVAEALYYQGRSVASRVSPFRSERIGSYSYDKGAKQDFNKGLLEAFPLIGDTISRLHDNSKPMAYGTRIEQVMPANPNTGVIDMVSAYNNRLARAVTVLGFVSDTEEFNQVVYGDQHLGWPF